MPYSIIKRQIDKNPKIHKKKDRWSDKQKLEAVTTYLLVGRWALVSEATNVPIDTLKKWKQTDWWVELEQEIKRSVNIQTSSKLKKIIDKSLNIIEDRLEHGDFQFNHSTQKFVRRPLGAKTVSEIANKAIDRDLILQKLEEKPDIKEEAIMDRLKAIQDQLRGSVAKKVPEIIDVTPTEVENGNV